MGTEHRPVKCGLTLLRFHLILITITLSLFFDGMAFLCYFWQEKWWPKYWAPISWAINCLHRLLARKEWKSIADSNQEIRTRQLQSTQFTITSNCEIKLIYNPYDRNWLLLHIACLKNNPGLYCGKRNWRRLSWELAHICRHQKMVTWSKNGPLLKSYLCCSD